VWQIQNSIPPGSISAAACPVWEMEKPKSLEQLERSIGSQNLRHRPLQQYVAKVLVSIISPLNFFEA
jgi:hypothetical protein